jgi:threonine synthase
MSILGEGNTPLISSAAKSNLLFKLENCNPSGSYKDRFAAVETARIAKSGAKSCMATSSGNTGSALASACARFGLECVVFVNKEAPEGKLAQMRAHGAKVVRVEGFASLPDVTERVFSDLQSMSREMNIPLVVSAYRYCPEGMAGVETIAHEILAQHSGPIHHVFVPLGGGGLFSAVCKGFRSATKIHAVQPAGCLTTVASFLRGDSEIRSVVSSTRVSGLSVPQDIDATLALGLLRECGGLGIAVTDEEVFEAQEELLRKQGIYCEPAGATAFAGYLQACCNGQIDPGETAICLVTGSGFKDPASIERTTASNPTISIEPSQVREMEFKRYA